MNKEDMYIKFQVLLFFNYGYFKFEYDFKELDITDVRIGKLIV